MIRSHLIERLVEGGLVAVVRSSRADVVVDVARALAEGGLRAIEITFTVPGAPDLIREARRVLGNDVLLGAGTVLDPETARAAILAGAQFLVAPTINLDVIRLAHRYDIAVMPGGFTPTEVLTAWEAGADLVKVFPAELGGPALIKALKAPLPQVRLMPTGGVDLNTAEAFLRAGAVCLGVGSSLIDPKFLADRNFAALSQRALQFVDVVRHYRESTGT
jgi:2-dehydro-3-deoxyphosphogluconate aldolase/(4S)-4-hydroxy-2-oxoglutarate aldolase